MKQYSLTKYLSTHKPNNGRFYTVAVDGRGGSGKTSFAEYLKILLPDFIFLNGDDYFEPIEDKNVWGAFNDERFINDVIKPLKIGSTFLYKPYDWHTTPNITEKSISVAKGICIERCFSFAFELEWDLKIWVETPKDVCLERGLSRDKIQKDKVIKAWKEVWQPREDEYIKKNNPLEKADIVIDGSKPFTSSLSAN